MVEFFKRLFQGRQPSESSDRLLAEFRQCLHNMRAIYREGALACVTEQAARLREPPDAFVRKLEDLERGLAAKVFVEMAHSDRQWSEREQELAAAVIEHLWNVKLEDGPLRAAIETISRKAATLEWAALLRPFITLAPLRERAPGLLTSLVRMSNIIAKADGTVRDEEAAHLRSLQGLLARELEKIPLADGDEPRYDPATHAQAQAVTTKPASVTARPPVTGDAPGPQAVAAALTPQERQTLLEGALAELEGLIGLAGIKHEIRELVNFLRVQAQRAAHGLPQTSVSLHMVFAGNPGTGKTTVARLLGRIFAGLGILQKGHLVETDRAGLVARYAGQTAPKSHKKIDEALDGVLFIDEAYSLIAAEGDDPYGHEALQVLLKRMEDDRQRLVIVLAGYPGPMAELLSANPGLHSRFSRQLEFPNYSASELGRIFETMCHAQRYVLTAQARAHLLSGFYYLVLHADETFGNGRLARNVFEGSIRRMANRIAGIAPLTVELLTTLQAEDIAMPDVPQDALDLLAQNKARLAATCPACKAEVRCSASRLGRRVQCKPCGHRFLLDWAEPQPAH
jgi:DNA-directed RNA polymerase subunit RPC12/RpoP